GTAEVEVTLRITDPEDLRKAADPTVAKDQAGKARQYLAEASGRLVLKLDAGQTPLRVPVYAAPKPVADLTADATAFSEDQGVLTISGRGLAQGSGDLAYRSLLSVFELQGTSDQLPDCAAARKADCAVNTTAKGADLRYVGAASTAPVAREQGTQADALLAFGVATWGNWVTLGSNNTPKVSIDTTGDGKPDFTVTVAKPKDANGGVTADVWLARTKSADGTVVDEQPLNGQYGDVDTNVMDTDVVVLPVSLTALGIDPAQASHRITYTVGTEGNYAAPGNADGFIDKITGPLSFDPLRPGLWAQGDGVAALTYAASAGTTLALRRDPVALAADKADSFLVLQHHNATGGRAHLVKVTAGG
ncbi:MAG: peptidase S8, partial [Umezawaea sp.]